jgi:hypothetical protein
VLDTREFITVGVTQAVTRGDNCMVMGEQPNNLMVRVLPDMHVCRAADLTGNFAECLVEKPAAYQYAMPFGYSYLCGHPDRSTIIDNTKRAQTRKQSL